MEKPQTTPAAPVADPASPEPAANHDPNTTPDPAAPPAPADDAAALRARLDKSVGAERNLRERLRKLEEEREGREKQAAEEQGKWKELYEKAVPRVKQAEEYEAIVQAMVESSTAELTPEQKSVLDALPESVTVGHKLKIAKQFAAANAAAKPPVPPPPGRPPTPPASAPRPTGSDGGTPRVWKESEINALSYADREKLMPEINAAFREGRIASG